MQYAIITDQICEDLERALQIAKAHHYSHVELHNVFGKSIEECSLAEVEHIRTLLQTYHLEVSCIASTVFFFALYMKVIKFLYSMILFMPLKAISIRTCVIWKMPAALPNV